MAYVILVDKCKRAGDCADICPTESIHAVEGNDEWSKYYINPETCIECGACMAECPNDAIVDPDDAADYPDDVKLNADFYTKGPGKDGEDLLP